MAETLGQSITVEVAYAEPDRQFLRRLELVAGTTIAQAIEASGVQREFGIDTEALTVGRWSKPVAREAVLENGDRIELYRPLKADPKEARRQRAKRAGAKRNPLDQP